MKCPKCGAENSAEAGFCESCGANLSESKQQTTPVVEGLLKVKKVILPYLKNKIVWAAIAAIVVVIILISAISSAISSNNGYISIEKNMVAFESDDSIHIVVENKTISDTVEGSYESARYSLDRSKLVFLTEENELYITNGKKITKVAEDVKNYKLSVEGTGIAYTVSDEDSTALYLYTVSNKKTVSIDEDVNSYVIAPNGKSVAYSVTDDEKTVLYYFSGSKSSKISTTDASILAMSDNGKYIYATSVNDDGETVLYSFNKSGEKTKLGTTDSSVRLNSDHTQILFFGDGKSYISTKSKEAVKVNSSVLSLVIPTGSSSVSAGNSAVTYPVKDLYNHVYTTDGSSVVLIKKNTDKNVKLVSNATGVTLDQSAKYVYYVYKSDELKVLKIGDGDNASEKAKTLVDDSIDKYVVTSDRKLVYYIADDTLYSVNGKTGKNTRTITSDDIESSLAITAKNVVYYIQDGDLYACSNGKKGKSVLKDTDAVSSANGVVYATSDGDLYVTKSSGKPKKILEG